MTRLLATGSNILPLLLLVVGWTAPVASFTVFSAAFRPTTNTPKTKAKPTKLILAATPPPPPPPPSSTSTSSSSLSSSTSSSTTTTTTILLDEWRELPNGRIEGKVVNHPELEDGSTISTSAVVDREMEETTQKQQNSFFFPLPSMTKNQQQQQNQQQEQEMSSLQENMTIETYSGSQYQLLRPAINTDTNNDDDNMVAGNNNSNNNSEVPAEQQEEGLSETKKLMNQVKDAGIAGVISYALWEFGFWTVSVPVCIFGYRSVTGHWPDFSNPDDVKQLGAEAFAFVNVARFAVPLRIGLALGTTPWIQKNIVDRFMTNSISSNNNNNQQHR